MTLWGRGSASACFLVICRLSELSEAAAGQLAVLIGEGCEQAASVKLETMAT